MPADALTRLDPDTAAPDPPALPTPLSVPWVVLVVHRIGTEGPWWCDCFDVLETGELGLIVHSTPFASDREQAVELGRKWVSDQQKTRISPSFQGHALIR